MWSIQISFYEILCNLKSNRNRQNSQGKVDAFRVVSASDFSVNWLLLYPTDQIMNSAVFN